MANKHQKLLTGVTRSDLTWQRRSQEGDFDGAEGEEVAGLAGRALRGLGLHRHQRRGGRGGQRQGLAATHRFEAVLATTCGRERHTRDFGFNQKPRDLSKITFLPFRIPEQDGTRACSISHTAPAFHVPLSEMLSFEFITYFLKAPFLTIILKSPSLWLAHS